MLLHRLDARREPRLLQTALSGTDADLSQALSQQLCFWTPYGHAKYQVCDSEGLECGVREDSENYEKDA